MKTWSDVSEVQPLASKILMNSIRKGRISHAYLLQGERGTGKEAIALLLAKGLFCTNKSDVDPCGVCNMCRRIESRNHPDVHWLEPDGQSIKIEQIKNLQKEFTYSGLESNRKVYIIKAADTLTLNAANRILKFLEEPSKQTTAIMLTENSQSIISTIRSRCQIIDLQPLNPTSFKRQLMDAGLQQQDAVLMSALTNNVDDAIAWSTDAWFAEGRKLVVQLVEMFVHKPEDVFLFIHQHWIPHFKERSQQEQGLDLLLLAFKDILYAHLGSGEDTAMLHMPAEQLNQLVMFYSQQKLITILHELLQAKRNLKQNVHATLVMEQLTLQIQR